MVDENIIEETMDEVLGEIKTCGVMNGSRLKEDCELSCQYRKICNKIFAMDEENTRLAKEFS